MWSPHHGHDQSQYDPSVLRIALRKINKWKMRHGFTISRYKEDKGSSVFTLPSGKLGKGAWTALCLAWCVLYTSDIIKSLLCARYCPKCFTPINIFNHHHIFMRWLLILFPFHWWVNPVLEGLRNLPKVTQFLMVESEFKSKPLMEPAC